MSVKIFVMAHKSFTGPADSIYCPLQVGSALHEDLGYLRDDNGFSISEKNPSFCELTGMYWIWKNVSADIVGIAHYRRYLIDEQEQLLNESQIEHILAEYDIISTKLITLNNSYYYGFSENHHQKDLDLTAYIIKKLYPDDFELFEELVHGPHTYFGNILICKKDLYDSYCAWLFPILFEVEKQVDMTGYNNYNRRLFGFLSEFLQTVWVRKMQLKIKECKVGMIEEKKETRELKASLADYFSRKDFRGAQDYFYEYYKKRPDVLMEASDITGELRLCMQVISTCNFESDAYGSTVLDSITDFRTLMHHFAYLNQVVNRFLSCEEAAEDIYSLKSASWLTPIAVSVSLQLFSSDTVKNAEILAIFQSKYNIFE